MRGGTEEDMQQRSLIKILDLIREKGYLPDDAVDALTSEYGCRENVIGTCSDTATTNLGNKKGAVTILEDLWHHPLLKFECQRQWCSVWKFIL